MRTVLPHFHHVDFATSEKNTLDLVYSNIKETFKAAPLPHLGSLCDTDSYIQALANQRKTHHEASENLACRSIENITGLLCFEYAYWDMFLAAATDNQHANVNEHAKSVSAYSQKCMEDVSVTRNIITYWTTINCE